MTENGGSFFIEKGWRDGGGRGGGRRAALNRVEMGCVRGPAAHCALTLGDCRHLLIKLNAEGV